MQKLFFTYQKLYYFLKKEKKKICIATFFLFIFNLQAASIVAPLRIEGIGNLLVIGYQWQQPTNDFLIGSAIGERSQNGFGANLKHKFANFNFIASFFLANQIQIPTTYTRGSAPAPLFYVNSYIQGLQIGADLGRQLTVSSHLELSLNLFNTKQDFKDILDENHNSIPTLESIFLGRFVSTLKQLSLGYNYKQLGANNYIQRGWQFYTRMKNSHQTTNTIYSETLVTDLDAAIYIPLGKIYFIPRVFYSKVQVTNQKEDNKEKLEKIFDIRCSNKMQNEQTCEDLKEKITENLARHNRYGTASPLGGINQLRSESILRYKGSQTQYQSVELRYLIATKKIFMEPVLFWEQGRSFDEENIDQERNFIQSHGVEYKFHINENLLYKLIYAQSDRNSAWQISVASIW